MKAISWRRKDLKERQLVNAFLIHGDEAAFRKLYRLVTPRLYPLVMRMLGGDEPGAQDVIQDTWIRCIQRIHDFRWEASFQTWISGIAINRCREQFRRRKRQKTEVAVEEIKTASDGTFDTVDKITLETAIERLPDGFRQVLVLHDIEGYKHREIAQLLEITSGTSKSQLFHARRALRGILKPEI